MKSEKVLVMLVLLSVSLAAHITMVLGLVSVIIPVIHIVSIGALLFAVALLIPEGDI